MHVYFVFQVAMITLHEVSGYFYGTTPNMAKFVHTNWGQCNHSSRRASLPEKTWKRTSIIIEVIGRGCDS